MSNSKGTIIVGGGRGFIGGHLCAALLRREVNVISVDSGLFEPSSVFLDNRTSSHLVDLTVDASDYQLMLSETEVKQPVQAVINCVGPARPSYYMENPIETASTLTNSTHSLLKLASYFSALYIHASSSEIYGNVTNEAIGEGTVPNANTLSLRSPYAEAKRFSETLTMSYVHKLHLRAVILRLFNVYGPGFSSDDDRVVAAFVHSLVRNKALQIHGDGTQIRSFCFIDDVIKSFEYSMSYDCSPLLCVNIGNPEPISILSLARLMGQRSNRPITVEHTEARQEDVKQRIPDVSKARDILGWCPEVMLEDGLIRTLSYYSLISETHESRISQEKGKE